MSDDARYGPPSITRALVRRWWLVVLLALIGAGGGVAFGLLQEPVYRAEAYAVVVADNKDTEIAVNFAQAYGRVIDQSEILEQVASTVGRTSAARLRSGVQASTSPDAPLIEITGSARTAARSAAIANAAVDALVVYANEHATETGVRLASFSRAAPPASPASPRPLLYGAVGAAAGVLIGGLAILAGIGRPGDGSRTGSPSVPMGPEGVKGAAPVPAASPGSGPPPPPPPQSAPPAPSATPAAPTARAASGSKHRRGEAPDSGTGAPRRWFPGRPTRTNAPKPGFLDSVVPVNPAAPYLP